MSKTIKWTCIIESPDQTNYLDAEEWADQLIANSEYTVTKVKDDVSRRITLTYEDIVSESVAV